MATEMQRARNVRLPDRVRGQRLLRLLGEQDGRLHSRKEALRNSVPAGTFGALDEAEQSWDNEELGVGISVLELTSQTVQEIETAVRRLEAGEYGTCSACRCRISPARLAALPFADRCRACQEKRDVATLSMRRRAALDEARP